MQHTVCCNVNKKSSIPNRFLQRTITSTSQTIHCNIELSSLLKCSLGVKRSNPEGQLELTYGLHFNSSMELSVGTTARAPAAPLRHGVEQHDLVEGSTHRTLAQPPQAA